VAAAGAWGGLGGGARPTGAPAPASAAAVAAAAAGGAVITAVRPAGGGGGGPGGGGGGCGGGGGVFSPPLGLPDVLFTATLSSYMANPRFVAKLARARVASPAAAAGSDARFAAAAGAAAAAAAKVAAAGGAASVREGELRHDLAVLAASRRAAAGRKAAALAVVGALEERRAAAAAAAAAEAAAAAAAAAADEAGGVDWLGWADDWDEFAGEDTDEVGGDAEEAAAGVAVDGESPLAPLTAASRRRVKRAWTPARTDAEEAEVLAEHRNIPLRRADAARLRPAEWLNDEVINGYINLLSDRNERRVAADPDHHPRVYFQSTFFYAKLVPPRTGYDYAGVRRWTRKVNVFAYDLMVVPINVANTHWALAAIDFGARTVAYYDSLGATGSAVTDALRRWVGDEARQRGAAAVLDALDAWTTVQHGSSCPQQENSDDCGVFACRFAEALEAGRGGEPWPWGGRHITYFRRRMLAELLVRRAM